METFEQKLSRQPLRQIPAGWRAEVLAAARQVETPRCGVGQRSALSLPAFFSTLNAQLTTWLWPHPKAWAGLAAIWILILAVDYSIRDKAPLVAEKSGPTSPEVVAQLREQQRLLAELMGPRDTGDADRSKSSAPWPRSERIRILAA